MFPSIHPPVEHKHETRKDDSYTITVHAVGYWEWKAHALFSLREETNVMHMLVQASDKTKLLGDEKLPKSSKVLILQWGVFFKRMLRETPFPS